MRRGRPRTITFHLTGTTTGGSATTELRAGPRVEAPFVVRSVEVLPQTAGQQGQFVDVRVAPDDYSGDSLLAPGVSIFEAQQGLASLPLVDRDVGLPVIEQAYDVPLAFEVLEPGRVLYVQSRFVAPALVLPVVHVVVVIEELATAAPPVEPRPPFVPAPPPVAPGPEAPAPEDPVMPRPPSVGGRTYCGPRRYVPGDVCPLPLGSGAGSAGDVWARQREQAVLAGKRFNPLAVARQGL